MREPGVAGLSRSLPEGKIDVVSPAFCCSIRVPVCERLTGGMASRIKVMIVDDHPLFRQGLRRVIEGDSRFDLIAESGEGTAALQLIQEKRPDVAVLDVNLPGLSGLEIARILQGKRLPT